MSFLAKYQIETKPKIAMEENKMKYLANELE
jgi:hypothetical protein